VSGARGAAGLTSAAPGAAVEFFEPPLSPELWGRYERAARSYTCSRAFLEYFERPAAATLAIVRDPTGTERSAFLYARVGGAARVYGRYTAPPAPEVAAFCEALFERHPELRRVQVDLVDALPDLRAVGRPVLVVRRVTERRVPLPGSAEEYEGTLGKDTRAQLRYLERRLARDHPHTRFATADGDAIPRAWIAEVVRLHHARMTSKSTRSTIDAGYEEGIFRVARAHGAVTVLLDGDRVCGGVVYVLAGPEVFGWVIGHDDAYAKYRPGKLCQLAAFRHCIARGARTYHFLMGEAGYKRELGGAPAEVASYAVLRSWASLRAGDVLRVVQRRLAREARRAVARADGLAARLWPGRPAPLTTLARALAGRARAAART
jgi:CelD/BcsL family acetyltransferase involved in cellulose biosynthesis